MLPSPASSLADDLARTRILYPSPLITAPSVLVIDVPPVWRGRGLLLDRYYALIIETDAEREEVEQFLTVPRSAPAHPDLLDHRPSNLWSETILISRYEPPAEGWPWLSIARWPDEFMAAARTHDLAMARGCYTMEMFDRVDELDAHQAAMLEGLRAHYPINVRMLTADLLPSGGSA